MKIDLHVHSEEISPCGKLSAREIAELYASAGYDAIVLTNHFNSKMIPYFEQKYGKGDFEEWYNAGYLKLAEEGEKRGLTVLNGYEIRFDGAENDYLVFGMDRVLARDCERLFRMTPEEFGALAREKGFLFYQAHPFRNGMKIVKTHCLFGMEVKNTHPRHDNRNDIAKMWAEKYALHEIGGSDCHQKEDAAKGGILTERNVKNMDDLVSVLRENAYTII